jgi:hypothetical protein
MLDVVIEWLEIMLESFFSWFFEGGGYWGEWFWEEGWKVEEGWLRMFFMDREIFVDREDDSWVSGLVLREFSLM